MDHDGFSALSEHAANYLTSQSLAIPSLDRRLVIDQWLDEWSAKCLSDVKLFHLPFLHVYRYFHDTAAHTCWLGATEDLAGC